MPRNTQYLATFQNGGSKTGEMDLKARDSRPPKPCSGAIVSYLVLLQMSARFFNKLFHDRIHLSSQVVYAN